jgi:hypothetical protein
LPLSIDHVTCDFKLEENGYSVDMRVTCSIRKVASFTIGSITFPRYVLSVCLEDRQNDTSAP